MNLSYYYSGVSQKEANNPLQRTNLVKRIEFAKHVILKHSLRSGQLQFPNNR